MTNPQQQTHYEVLNVAQSATTEQIKKAFRALARENHPDTLSRFSETDPKRVAAGEKMKRVTHAHDVLSNADKRREYDFSLMGRVPFQNRSQSSSSMTTEEMRRQGRERMKKAAEDNLRSFEMHMKDQNIRGSLLYLLVNLTLLLAIPWSSLVTVAFGITFVAQLLSGVSIGGFFFSTVAQPEAVSLAPIVTALIAAVIGWVIRFACRFYLVVLEVVYETVPLPTIKELSALLKKTPSRPFIIAGLAGGVLIGHMFF